MKKNNSKLAKPRNLVQINSEAALISLAQYQEDILAGKLAYPALGAERQYVIACLDSKEPNVQIQAAVTLRATGWLWHLSKPAQSSPKCDVEFIQNKIQDILAQVSS